MRKTLIVIAAVAGGIVGAWGGYWIGHGLGWSENADWPWRIGGGAGAILLSIGLSVASVLLVLTAATLWPHRHARRILIHGQHARGKILTASPSGVGIAPPGRADRRQFVYDLEVMPPVGVSYRARATTLVTADQAADLRPGAIVDVRYDPDHPDWVALESAVGTPVG